MSKITLDCERNWSPLILDHKPVPEVQIPFDFTFLISMKNKVLAVGLTCVKQNNEQAHKKNSL